MGVKGYHLLVGFLVFCAISVKHGFCSLNRTSFPEGFVFGAASSAYQTEGAAYEGGKGLSIWDIYTRKYRYKIRDHSSANIATDSYHRYKEDVRTMRRMHLDAYRFSISWSRVLPRKLNRGVNEEGIIYYNNLINELRGRGVEPYVTLFHWDLPQALEDDYQGFLSHQIVDDFRDYADLCFSRFGDRVKNWITLNEPWSYSIGGYETGSMAPGRCSSWLHDDCAGGDSSTEPYLVSHHQLLAHAAAAKLYKEKYQASQQGQIGIILATRWFVPFSAERIHQDAATRALDFNFGWFMNPLTFGDYPQSMRTRVTNRLPKFSNEESNMIKGSFDFLGLNYYTANYAAHVPDSNYITPNKTTFFVYSTDSKTNLTAWRNGVPIGPQGGSSWLYVYPRGLLDLLLYIKNNYNNPVIYITENGIDEINNSTLSIAEALTDTQRVDYYRHHLTFLQRAISEGVDVRGFFMWSLMDNFEWSEGYTVRFGLNYVDFQNGSKRYAKLSARWLTQVLQK